ncbi:ROK family protein [Pelagibius sp. Alg239-R121]|uniref:ROK family protein n=1 Tax=Pelagibius sp. Alg239-R121 TaxID=2993448 RepID=UPI0024A75878|nr:ROK family protein [Pelagibius sp. Alg239-R121]
MRIGIDLGGTKIEGVVLSPDGTQLMRRRIDTPAGNYDATIAAVGSLVDSIERDIGKHGTIGVGIPGAVSLVTDRVKNANSTCLIGHPIEQDLSAAVGRPVRVMNDANCFVLSEASDGAASQATFPDARVIFGIILGTGVGGGIVMKGEALSGRNAIAGEWGHNPLPWPRPEESPGPPCYCGKSGCIETFLCGPSLFADYCKQGGDAKSTREMVERAASGDDDLAEAALQRYEDRLSRALAMVINVLDPDVIVLGGGISNIERLYQTLPKRLPEYVFSDSFDTMIVPPKHGDSSGVRGAAWLWSQAEADQMQSVWSNGGLQAPTTAFIKP